MQVATKCPGPNDLMRFLSGRLPASEAEPIEEHLKNCPQCIDSLGKLAAEETLVGSAENTDVEPVAAENTLVGKLIEKLKGISADTDATLAPRSECSNDAAVLAGHPRYRVLELLGVGGMGSVYKAEHLLMQRPVALKIINRSLTNSALAVERFEREVVAAAQLTHPNIVTAFDAERWDDTHFLAMEYVEGISLQQVIARQGPLPIGVTAAYIAKAAQGLQHAFERGMAHRDIKPHNIMLTTDGQIKILDFGLARFVRENTAQGGMTQEGSLLGTPDYIAPEQVRDTHGADIRSDIYSLGCTFYALLAGRPPFPTGNAIEKVMSHLERAPQPISEIRADVPGELVQVLERMIAKDPADRYQTPEEAVLALTPFMEDNNPVNMAKSDSTAIEPMPAGARSRSPRRRRPLLIATIGVTLVALAGFVIYLVTDKGEIAIVSEDPNVEITISNGGKVVNILDAKTKTKATFNTGDYSISLSGSAPNVKIEGPTTFHLYRGESRIVTIRSVNQGERRIVEPKKEKDTTPDLLVVDIGKGVTMVFVRIKAGDFLMGSPDSDPDAHEDEKPQHRVKITRDFYLGKYPVTQEQYSAVIGKNPSMYSTDYYRFQKGKNVDTRRYPVEKVLWDDAAAYCAELTKRDKQGRLFTLPTEAEWEYAQRAGTTTRFSFGDDPANIGDYAWYNLNADHHTHEVGTKKPNRWGLYDMEGNVWQWCADWYEKGYYAVTPREDPKGPESNPGKFWNLYVVRGNHHAFLKSMGDPALNSRAARRVGSNRSSSDTGFRVCLRLGDADVSDSKKK
jgi:serine/threonine protein kinase/formylglycine-generating enzyme required for sulfatase activity